MKKQLLFARVGSGESGTTRFSQSVKKCSRGTLLVATLAMSGMNGVYANGKIPYTAQQLSDFSSELDENGITSDNWKKMRELAKLFDEVDESKIRNCWSIEDTVKRLRCKGELAAIAEQLRGKLLEQEEKQLAQEEKQLAQEEKQLAQEEKQLAQEEKQLEQRKQQLKQEIEEIIRKNKELGEETKHLKVFNQNFEQIEKFLQGDISAKELDEKIIESAKYISENPEFEAVDTDNIVNIAKIIMDEYND